MHHCPPGAAEYWCQLGSGWAREKRVWSAFQRLPAGSSLARASQRKMCQRPKLSFCLLIMGWSNCIRSHLKTGFNISVLWHIDTWQSQKYQFSTVPNLTNLQLSQNLSGAHSNRGFDAIQSQQQHFLGSWYILLPISLFQFQSYPNVAIIILVLWGPGFKWFWQIELKPKRQIRSVMGVPPPPSHRGYP